MTSVSRKLRVLALCAISLCSLFTVSCNSPAGVLQETAQNAEAKGRYVESIIPLPDCFATNELDIGKYAAHDLQKVNGDVLLIGTPIYTSLADIGNLDADSPVWRLPPVVFRLNPDNSFTDVTPGWLKNDTSGLQLGSVFFMQNGDAYAMYEDLAAYYKNASTAGNSVPQVTVKFYSHQGQSYETLDMDIQGYFQSIQALEDGTLFLINGGQAEVYRQGAQERLGVYNITEPVLALEPGSFIARPAEAAAYGNGVQDGLYLRNASTGETETQLTPDELFPQTARFMYNTSLAWEEDGVYLQTPQGIYYQKQGTESWQQLVDAAFAPILCQGGGGNALAGGYAEDIYFLSNNLYRFYYNPAAKTSMDNRLTVFSMEESDYLRKAVELFQRDNPDLAVITEVGDTIYSRNEQVQKLNTKIAAGAGPDVFLLDGLPWESYVEKGVLLDISIPMGKLLEGTEYYNNVVCSYETDSGLYALPSRFDPVFAVGTDDIRTFAGSLSGLAEYAAKHPDMPVLAPCHYQATKYRPHDLLRMMYSYYSGELYDETGIITAERLNGWLAAGKALYDRVNSAVPAAESTDWADYEVYTILKKRQGSLALLHCVSDSTLRALSQSGHFDCFTAWPTGQFTPKMIGGVSAACKQPEKAAELIMHLFSEPVQQLAPGIYQGMPVHKGSLRRQLEQEANNGWKASPQYADISDFPITQQDIDWYISSLDTVRMPIVNYSNFQMAEPDVVLAAMMELTPDYFQGKRSLESVQSELMNHIQLMQNE